MSWKELRELITLGNKDHFPEQRAVSGSSAYVNMCTHRHSTSLSSPFMSPTLSISLLLQFFPYSIAHFTIANQNFSFVSHSHHSVILPSTPTYYSSHLTPSLWTSKLSPPPMCYTYLFLYSAPAAYPNMSFLFSSCQEYHYPATSIQLRHPFPSSLFCPLISLPLTLFLSTKYYLSYLR